VAFGVSAVAGYIDPATGQLRNAERSNLGTLIGAVRFFAGALLLLPERTEEGGLQVAEPARLLLGHGHGDRVLAEVSHRVAEVVQEQGCHVPAYAEPDQDALHGDV